MSTAPAPSGGDLGAQRVAFAAMVALLLLAPLVVYPVFMMKVMCFALFASAFNLLLGYGGLLSFGHAAYFGLASYVCATAARSWGLDAALAILLGTAAAGGLGAFLNDQVLRRE